MTKESDKADKDRFLLPGIVIESLNNATFRVKLDRDGSILMTYASGKMIKEKIRIIVGDQVHVQTTPYDKTRGIIKKRQKIIRQTTGKSKPPYKR